MRRCLIVTLATGTLLVFAGCITRPASPDSYYSLSYLQRSEKDGLFRSEPFDATVHVRDTRVAQAYTRPQIVVRGIGPQFEYLGNELWGVDLRTTVAGLVSRRLESYGIFAATQRDFEREDADYELRSSLGAIEYVRYEGTRQARVEIELSLWNVREREQVVVHRGSARRSVFGDDVSIFVSEANEMLFEQIDAFLERVAGYLETGEPQTALLTDRRAERDQEEETGPGVLLLPALGQSENQPYYTIIGSDGTVRGSGQFGVPVDLAPGTYSVAFGSGPEDEQMTIDRVTISPRERTIVEPTWAAMTVEIIDETREQVRARYDIYDAETGVSYGGRISQSEALVASQTVWILPPARYKIVINNRPFNTLRDFITVNLVAGRSEDLTIVVGSDDSGNVTSMLGAGNVDLDEIAPEDTPLRLTSAINGSFSFTLDNRDAPDDFEAVYFLDSEIDTELVYETGPLRYDLENNVAIGLNALNARPLRVASDEFRLRNTLVYGLTNLYGVYARADASATIVGRRVVPDEPTNYVKRDNGTTVERETDAELIVLSPPFLPVTLREGAGISIAALRSQRAELGIRGGVGATQTIRYNVYESAGTETIDESPYNVYSRRESEFATGFEISASATFQLPLSTTVSSVAELFVPFNDVGSASVEWENVVSIVLVNNVSLYYRFVLANAATADDDHYLVQDHGVFIRLNYLFR